MARTQRNRIPHRNEIIGGAAVVALVATVYLVRGGPDITSASEPDGSVWRAPATGGPEPAPMRSRRESAGESRDDANHTQQMNWPDAR